VPQYLRQRHYGHGKIYEHQGHFGNYNYYYQDNAKPNDCLLHDFEKVQEQYENLGDHEQAQRFRVSNGDIIINLAVQAGRNLTEEFHVLY
jgi:hypothetical protein